MQKTLLVSLSIFFLFSSQLTFSQADAGPDQDICADNTTMQAVNPAPSSGQWTVLSGSGIFMESTNYNTLVTDIAQGSNVYRWQVGGDIDDVEISNNSPSAAIIAGPTIKETCDGTSILSAMQPIPYYATDQYWTQTGGSGTFIDASTSFRMNMTDLAPGNNTYSWSVENGSCPANVDYITITNNEVTADAGLNQIICTDYTTLNATDPLLAYPNQGTGHWENISMNSAIIENPLQNNTTVSNLPFGMTTLRWSVEQVSCQEYNNVQISNNSVIAIALDDETCNSDIIALTGNFLGPGESGEWTCFTPGVTFDDSNLYNTGAHNLVEGVNNFTWTISNANCSNAVNIVITSINPNANAGADQNICANYTFLSAQDPTPGIGMWSVLTGSGIFTDNTDWGTFVSDIGIGVNIFLWTVTENGCANSDHVTIINNSVTAIVGDSIFVCGTEAFLNGNEPHAGQTGIWTRTEGTGIIANTGLYNTYVTNLNVDINKFRWTISNGTCEDYADLVVRNNLYNATASVAGPIVICVDSADLLANIPVQGCTGHWEVIAGGGVFSDQNSPTTRVNNLLKGENTLRWFITKNGCTSYADVKITNNSVEAYAGSDIITCGNDANLSANNLLQGETGLWQLIAGSGTILSLTNNETVITNQSSGVSVYQWTVYGNGCTDSDIVQINENAFLIEAGPSQTVCSADATLMGQNPIPGTGIWTNNSGITINNPTNYVSTVTGIQDNTVNIFRWTVTKNGCSAWDEVTITNNMVHADAGDDQTICMSSTQLSAQNPIAGNGLWNIISGSGTISSPTYFASTVTGLNPGTITLTWTVINGNCTDVDDMVITNNIVMAYAGADQAGCEDFATLDGDFPQPGSYGIWEVADGSGIIQTPSAFNTQVTELQRGVNTFRWTVYENGCTNGGDLVQIINNDFDADAGPDQTLEPLDTDTYFEAILPENCTGQWSILSGSANIHTDTSPTSFVYNMSTGTHIFTWAVHNNLTGCSDNDEVAIIVANFVPDAGEDQIVCTDTAKLNAAVEPGASSHTWSTVSGSGVFDDIHDSNTVVRGISHGANVYRWTVTFIGYSNYDDVIIFNDSIYVSAGDDAITCAREHTMNAQQILNPDSTWWSPVGFGGGTIVDNRAWNTLVTNLAPGDSYFEWYVSNGNCISRDTVMLHYNLPPIAQFETDPTDFCAPALVTIQNTSTQFGGQSPPDVFEWVIEDDGGIADTYDINGSFDYNFTNIGEIDSIYHIRLIAIDNETGCRATFFSEVNALAAPMVEFQILPDEPLRIPNAVFTFQNQSDANLVSYEWDFGNGEDRYDTEFVGSFDYEYFVEGTYTVSLFGTDNNQCNLTYVETLEVLPGCPSSYTGGSIIAEGYAGLTVQFYNNVEYADDPAFTKWHFYGPGDDVPNGINPDTSTYINDPIYTYTEPGIFHPYITAWNESCGSEASPYYNRVDTVIVMGVSVDEINANFKVYPNPTSGLITVSSTTDLSDAVFELKNIAGQEVQYKLIEQTSHSYGIDLSNLAYGVYFLKINLKGETKMLRLVKK